MASSAPIASAAGLTVRGAYRLWANGGLAGQRSHFGIACGADTDPHAAQVRSYLDADIDEVYVQQIGPDKDGFFAAWERDVLPQLRQ